MRRALAIARRTVRHRARGNLVFLVVVQPVIFCVVWGFCVSLELTGARVAVLDRGLAAETRARVRALEASGVLRVTEAPRTVAELERALASGRAGLGVVVTRAGLALVADGSDATLATLGASALAAALRPPAARVPVRVWHRPTSRSAHLLLLGALCYNLVWILAYPAASLMEERERGGLRMLALTPLTPFELWLGTAAPYLGMALWGALSQIALAVAVAGLPLRGDPLLGAAGLALLALTHVNLGFVVAAVARTGAQRTLGQLVLVFLMLAVSGFLVPDLVLPPWLRPLGEAVPLHHGLRFARGLFLRGVAGARDLAALLAFALVSTAVAVRCAASLLGDRR